MQQRDLQAGEAARALEMALAPSGFPIALILRAPFRPALPRDRLAAVRQGNGEGDVEGAR
ncbi:hypothetical protein D9599_16110 [Roseomonas sp. KE2513]|nr:hypothetical protein [Roseomonas sp. KE2513]